jgi:hypothetical protein
MGQGIVFAIETKLHRHHAIIALSATDLPQNLGNPGGFVLCDPIQVAKRIGRCHHGAHVSFKPSLPARHHRLASAPFSFPMLDIRLIRDNPDQVKQRLAHRSGDLRPWSMKCWRSTPQRRAAETERQKLQSDRNRISKEIGIAKKNGQDTSAIEAEVRGIGSRIDEIGREADASDAKQRDLLLSIPNLPHEACPVGSTAEENPEVRVWGAKPKFAFRAEGSHGAWRQRWACSI